MLLIAALASQVQASSRVVGVIMEPGRGQFAGRHLVPSSVVKLVEMNGFQAVPVYLNSSSSDLLLLLRNLNAVVFSFQQDTFNKAEQQNLQRLLLEIQVLDRTGTVIPLLALGNGMNKLFSILVPETTFVVGEIDQVRPLALGPRASSIFFKGIDEDLIKDIQGKGLFYFNVFQGTLCDTIDRNSVLSNLLAYTSEVKDGFNRRIAASVQGKTSPLFGTLFSPQANIFEPRLGRVGAEHSYSGVKASQQVLLGFFELARASPSRMGDDQLNSLSFLNFQVTPGTGAGVYSWYIL